MFIFENIPIQICWAAYNSQACWQISQGQMLYDGDLKCYDLATRGPCPKSQWFVAHLISPVVVCQARPCGSARYVRFGSRCKEVGSGKLCQEGLVLKVDIYGRGKNILIIVQGGNLVLNLFLGYAQVIFPLFTEFFFQKQRYALNVGIKVNASVSSSRKDPI